jgi:hypothetical protein
LGTAAELRDEMSAPVGLMKSGQTSAQYVSSIVRLAELSRNRRDHGTVAGLGRSRGRPELDEALADDVWQEAIAGARAGLGKRSVFKLLTFCSLRHSSFFRG